MSTINSTNVSKKLGKVITVVSARGGSGSTSLSILLGSVLSQTMIKNEERGEERIAKTIVVDLDLKDGHVGFLTGYVKPTIASYKVRLEEDEATSDIHSSIIDQRAGKPDLMLPPKRSRTIDDFTPEFYVNVVKQLQEHYDYIILNPASSNYDVFNTEVAYKLSDKVFYILDTSIVSVFSCHKWLAENVRRNPLNQDAVLDKEDVSIVVNDSRSRVVENNVESALESVKTLTRIGYSDRFDHMTNSQAIEEALSDEKLVNDLAPVVEAVLAL